MSSRRRRRRLHSRADFHAAKRIVIKAGTSVVSCDEGFPSLVRLANIVESAAKLARAGKEVLIVSSGAVGIGRRKLHNQFMARQSLTDVLRKGASGIPSIVDPHTRISYNSACAAAGQMGLVSLYETMFSQFGLSTSQLLVTAFDFTSTERKNNLEYVLSELLDLGVIPIINENDAVTGNMGYETCGEFFADNDSLAGLVADLADAQLMILLTDVDGVYSCNPKLPSARLIDVLEKHHVVDIGEKSLYGRGGMKSKINAMFQAADNGVDAVVIASGKKQTIIDRIIAGEHVGTVAFAPDEDAEAVEDPLSPPGSGRSTPDSKLDAITMAQAARTEGRKLKLVSTDVRNAILNRIASELELKQEEILEVNKLDLAAAAASNLSLQLLNRLKLTPTKVSSCVNFLDYNGVGMA